MTDGYQVGNGLKQGDGLAPNLFNIFFLLALQPPLGVVFYSPLVGFSLLAYEVF